MELIKPRPADWLRLYRLYRSAFPRNERKPVGMILSMCKAGTAEVLSIVDGGRFCGLAITVLYKDMVLLDYFAVKSSSRGQGLGSKAIKIIGERYSDKRLFLEIESPDDSAPNNSERVRRKAFYLRNGLAETGVFVKLFGVNMELLTFDCGISFEDYHSLYRFALGKPLADKNVVLR